MNGVAAQTVDFGISDRDFAEVARILHKETGIVVTEAKRAMVVSRLSRRARSLQLPSIAAYCGLISSDRGRGEMQHLISALTTNVTRFLREEGHFEDFETRLMPSLAKRARDGGRVRLWSAGCSTGQEAYTLAFSLLSGLPEAATLDVKLLATDIDAAVVEQAVAGRYREDQVAALPERLREAFLRREDGETWVVGPKAREFLTFRPLNLLHDWPFHGAFDVIMCRNVTIYFDAATQDRLWCRFAAQMPEGATLYSGHSENVTGAARQFFSHLGASVYQRNAQVVTPEFLNDVRRMS